MFPFSMQDETKKGGIDATILFYKSWRIVYINNYHCDGKRHASWREIILDSIVRYDRIHL